MVSYSRKDIVRLAPMKDRLVAFYTDQGLVIPEEDPGEGRGKVKRYSKKNLRQFRLIATLTKFGIKIGVLRDIMNDLLTSRVFDGGHPDLKHYLIIEADQYGISRLRGPVRTRPIHHSIENFKRAPVILTIDLEELFRDL